LPAGAQFVKALTAFFFRLLADAASNDRANEEKSRRFFFRPLPNRAESDILKTNVLPFV
jgi:hypothetical protein